MNHFMLLLNLLLNRNVFLVIIRDSGWIIYNEVVILKN